MAMLVHELAEGERARIACLLCDLLALGLLRLDLLLLLAARLILGLLPPVVVEATHSGPAVAVLEPRSVALALRRVELRIEDHGPPIAAGCRLADVTSDPGDN